jgi:hypothetical protein
MAQLKAQVDKLLTNVAIMQKVKGTVAEQLFPSIKTAQYSGLLGKYGKSHLRIENSVKGGRGKYRRVETITRLTQQFLIEGHGLEGFVSKEDYVNVETPFEAERDEVLGLQSALILEKEKVLADAITATGTMTQNVTLTGANQLSDYLNSDPIDIFSDARQAIMDGCGEIPNVAVMDYKVWDKLRFHPQMLDALGFKESRPGGLNEAELASAMGVEKLLVAQARYNSAKEGQADSMAPVWGKDIVMMVAPPALSVGIQTLGFWVTPSGSSPRKVYKQSNFNPPGSTAILVEDEYDLLLSDVACGYLIKSAIA